MGFFDFIDNVVDVVTDLGSTIRDCGKIIKDGLVEIGETIVDGVKDWLFSDSAKESARKINSANADSARALGQMSSYDRQNASIAEMKQLNDELGKVKGRAAKESESFESALIDIGRKSIDTLAQSLADNGKDFVKQCEAELKKIQGFVLNEISNKISLDNEKCVEILSEKSGKAKETKMQDFIAKTTQKAFRKMGDRFVDSVENSVESMIKALQSKLEVRQTMANNQLATLEKIKVAKNVEQKQSEQANIACQLNKNIAILNAIKGV